MRLLLPIAALALAGCAAPTGTLELAAYGVSLPPELDDTEVFVDWDGDDPMRSVRCELEDDGWSATYSLTARDNAMGDGFSWSVSVADFAGAGSYAAARGGGSVVAAATGADWSLGGTCGLELAEGGLQGRFACVGLSVFEDRVELDSRADVAGFFECSVLDRSWDSAWDLGRGADRFGDRFDGRGDRDDDREDDRADDRQ